MQDLFRKYLDNQCSPAEVQELLTYFKETENEILLRKLIAESLENLDEAEGMSRWHPATDKAFEAIKMQMSGGKAKLVPIHKKPWIRVAAAFIVLIGGFLAFNLIKSGNSPAQETAKTNNTGNDMAPGNNKAILKLADGSTLTLQAMAKGNITQQGDTKIVKSGEGKLAYNALNEKPTEVFVNKLSTPRGGQYELTLSDGSKAWLNAASSIQFPAAFVGNERRVEITGEVYFEVAKNPSMPFKVNAAGKAEVEVLGTHFNINAYGDESAINTILLEGSVKLTGMNTRKSTVITPGEQARLAENGQLEVKKLNDPSQVISWKTGSFNFNDASLEMVLKQLSRWYDVDIVFEGPVPQRRFNGEIQRDLDLSQVLKLLEKNDVHFKLEGKKLIVLK